MLFRGRSINHHDCNTASLMCECSFIHGHPSVWSPSQRGLWDSPAQIIYLTAAACLKWLEQIGNTASLMCECSFIHGHPSVWSPSQRGLWDSPAQIIYLTAAACLKWLE